MKRVLYSGFKFSHHSNFAGYDKIADDFPKVFGNNLPLSKYLNKKKQSSIFLQLHYLIVDVVTLIKGIQYDVIHYIYPENTSFFSAIILKKVFNKKIVYTLHLQSDFWLSLTGTFNQLKKISLSNADEIIVLAKDHGEELIGNKLIKNYHVVPHGFNFEHPQPDNDLIKARKNKKQITCVGSNYRDFDVLEKIIIESPKNYTFNLIGLNESNRLRFSKFKNVTCHKFLSDSDYNYILTQSFALLLPLTYATANNALLEAYRVSLPVLYSDVPGINEYTIFENLRFFSSDDFWEKIIQLETIADSDYKNICCSVNEKAKERFSWEKIHEKLQEIY